MSKLVEIQMPYKDYIANEINTLAFLNSQPFIAKNLASLSDQVKTTYYRYKSKDYAKVDLFFNFEFKTYFEKKERQIFLEGKILKDYSDLTYAITIIEDGQVLRKFHFDMAQPITGQSQKPYFHLQYCGKDTPLIVKKKLDLEPLHPWLSVPRINIKPFNFALLLDLVFIELHDIDSHAIKENPLWRQFVKKNETKILQPYYKAMFNFFNKDHKDSLLFRDIMYGK